MLTTRACDQSSPPEVMSRFRQHASASGSPYFSAKPPVFPESTPSAADRAAAAAASGSLSRGSSRSPQPPVEPPAAYLGPAPAPRGAAAAADSSTGRATDSSTGRAANGHAASSGAMEGPASSAPFRTGRDGATRAEGAARSTAAAAQGSASGMEAAAKGGGYGWPQSVTASEASQASMHSEPAKPADYATVLGMLERVRLPSVLSSSKMCVSNLRRANSLHYHVNVTELHCAATQLGRVVCTAHSCHCVVWFAGRTDTRHSH